MNWSRKGQVEANWIDEDTLEARTYGIINCGNVIDNGDYEIVGDRIFLKFESIGEDLADCMCTHNLTYRFHNLEKNEYTFELQTIRVSGSKRWIEPVLIRH